MTTVALMTFGLYVIATVACAAQWRLATTWTMRAARGATVAAWLAGAAVLAGLCKQGLHPLMGLPGLLSFVSWMLALGVAASCFRRKFVTSKLFGIVVIIEPAAAALLVISALLPTELHHPAQISAMSAQIRHVHLALVGLSLSIVALAAAVSVLYVFQVMALRRGLRGALIKRIPALSVLDRVGRRCVMVGFPFLVLAIVSGFLGYAEKMAKSGFRVEHGVTIAVGVVWGALVWLRQRITGERAAQWTLASAGGILSVVALYVFRMMSER